MVISKIYDARKKMFIDEDDVHDYQERIGIMFYDGELPLFHSEKEAWQQVKRKYK